jgi:parallel beta-helix repeat protein
MKKRFYYTSSITLVGILVVLFIGISLAQKGYIFGKVFEDDKSVIANSHLNTYGYDKVQKRGKGTTSQRPTGIPQGFVYFDTSLKRVIYWNGELWVSNSIINMKDFGAKGDGITNDTEVIQRALNIAGNFGNVKLYFPMGIYNTTALRLYKNTSIHLSDHAVIRRIGKGEKVFINGQMGNLNFATGYNGEGNIHFYGGTIDLNTINAPIPNDKGTSAFDLAHAQNISFKGLKIKNGQNGHYIQISSSKDIVFDECWFGDVQYTDPSSKNYELIQIEEATMNSFPTFGSYDRTVSKNITIKNSHFENVIRAVGTHSYSGKIEGIAPIRYSENIKIINNVFKNSISQFGHFEAFKNLTFENNILENCGENPIYLFQSKNNIIKNNYILGSQKPGIELNDTDLNRIENNLMINTCLDNKQPCKAIQGYSSKYNKIFNNVTGITKISSPHSNEVSFTGESKGNQVINNEFINGVRLDNNLIRRFKNKIEQAMNSH